MRVVGLKVLKNRLSEYVRLAAGGRAEGLRALNGRSGRGPREVANPTDLKIDGLGRVWILDPTNMRLTILSAAGSVDQSLRLPAGLVRIAPHADSTFVALGGGVKAFVYRLDDAGQVLSIGGAPAILDAVPHLLRKPPRYHGGTKLSDTRIRSACRTRRMAS